MKILVQVSIFERPDGTPYSGYKRFPDIDIQLEAKTFLNAILAAEDIARKNWDGSTNSEWIRFKAIRLTVLEGFP